MLVCIDIGHLGVHLAMMCFIHLKSLIILSLLCSFMAKGEKVYNTLVEYHNFEDFQVIQL